MIKISIQIDELHPAIVSALSGRNVDAILAAVNDVIDVNSPEQTPEFSGNIRTKEGKKQITVSASGKLSGIVLPKESPAAHLARCHWYLSGSKDYYLRVESVSLPLSVREWVAGKQFDAVEKVTA